jgi:hypothetical protein
MDDMDAMEEEMHRMIDELNLSSALAEAMRQLWLQQLEDERRKRQMH